MQEALIQIVGGVALSFLISLIFKKVLPRLAKRTRSDFDDFILREITNLIFPLGSLAVLLLAEDKLQLPGGLNRPYEIILTIAAAVVQASKAISFVPEYPFDHNAAFHVIQILAIYFLLSGVIKS